ncbi:MAG: hypothetical protein FWD57_17330, partial [Polyangiaceae bacterium]|nr:hypothetical protein [Polyangiaceae bacterium]
RLDDAREQFLRLIQVAPEDPHGFAGLADCLYRLGRDEEAARVVVEAVNLLGNEDPSLRIHHARLLLMDGELEMADALFASIAEARSPYARDAWAWLGLTRLVGGQHADATRCAEFALSYDRNHPLGTYVLAMALSESNNPDAQSWLLRARQLMPNNSVLTDSIQRAAPK